VTCLLGIWYERFFTVNVHADCSFSSASLDLFTECSAWWVLSRVEWIPLPAAITARRRTRHAKHNGLCSTTASLQTWPGNSDQCDGMFQCLTPCTTHLIISTCLPPAPPPPRRGYLWISRPSQKQENQRFV
jgi:hypothetical protein